MKTHHFSVTCHEATLSGQVTIPEGAKHAVVTVHGSYIQTREGDLDDSKPWFSSGDLPKRRLFLDIENVALAQGMASVRYDKRGSGESTGAFETSDLSMLAEDLISVCRYVKTHFGLSPVVVGQSEGGATALLANSLGLECEAYVLQNSLLQNLADLMEFQKDRAAQPFLNDRNTLFQSLPVITEIYWRTFNDPNYLKAMHQTDSMIYPVSHLGQEVNLPLGLLRSYANFDAAKLLDQVERPLFMLFSEFDGNCPPGMADPIAKSHPEFHIYRLNGLDHSFREYVPGLSFVEAMKNPVSDRYLECLKGILSSIAED